jgi:hypothetical protein
MSKYVEIRHNGNFVARYEDIPGGKSAQDQAEAGAKAMFGAEGEGVTIQPGGDFELHCADGFITSFSSKDAAQVHLDAMAKGHADHVARGGAAALRAAGSKDFRASDDPGLEIKAAS